MKMPVGPKYCAYEAKNKNPLHHVLNLDLKQSVRQIITDYHPMKTKDIGVKMRLVLKDEIPTKTHEDCR